MCIGDERRLIKSSSNSLGLWWSVVDKIHRLVIIVVASLSTQFASTSKFLTAIDYGARICKQAYFSNIFSSIFCVSILIYMMMMTRWGLRIMLHDGDDISAGFFLLSSTSTSIVILWSASYLLLLVTILLMLDMTMIDFSWHLLQLELHLGMKTLMKVIQNLIKYAVY